MCDECRSNRRSRPSIPLILVLGFDSAYGGDCPLGLRYVGVQGRIYPTTTT